MKKSSFKKWWIVLVFILALILPILFYLITFTSIEFSKQLQDWGQFGGYFGGVLGTMLSILSVILIYATYQNQVENSTLQQFESTFFNFLQNQREILMSMEGYFDLAEPEKGQNYMASVASLLSSKIEIPNEEIPIDSVKYPKNEKEKADAWNEINNQYWSIFSGREAELGHYFRHLYHFFKYVLESKIPNKDKKKYIDIIQAQMSDDELYVGFYNGISEFGCENFLPKLDENNFFENIRSRGVRFDMHAKIFYPKTKFKSTTKE